MAASLQTQVFGKKNAEELIDLFLARPEALGLGAGTWYWSAERSPNGLTTYNFVAPMAEMAKWLQFVQQNVPLYVHSDIRLSPQSLMFLQRGQTIVAWNREHVHISYTQMPIDKAFAPTYVQLRAYADEVTVPNLLPRESLAADSLWRDLPADKIALRLSLGNKRAYASLSEQGKQTRIVWRETRPNALLTSAWLVRLQGGSFELGRFAGLAALLPERAGRAQLIEALKKAPKLSWAMRSAGEHLFSLEMPADELISLVINNLVQ